MKRNWGAGVLLAALGGLSGCFGPDAVQVGGCPGGSGCASGPGTYMNSYRAQSPMEGEAHQGVYQMAEAPGVVGPYGEPIPRTAPYATSMSAGESAARAAFLQQFPPSVIGQTDLLKTGKIGSEIMQTGFQCSAGGCGAPGYPSSLMPAGGPMPGGLPPGPPNPFGPKPPGAVAAVGALTGGCPPFAVQRTEVRFVSPAGMRITWYGPTPEGKAGFGPTYIEAPGRYNFAQACIYRLKLSDIPNHPGLEPLYPTLEVVPTNARTATFLAHSAVPVSFTEDDFAQVAAGNYVVKVIYLPDPQYQDIASTGPAELVSSPLEPGVDPIAEAHRRGSILLVVRMGNIDLEALNTPPMDAPSPYQPRPQMPPPGMGMMPPGMGPGGMGGAAPGPMVPYGALGNAGMMPPQGMMPPGMMPPQGMMPPGMMPPGSMIPPELRQRGPGPMPTFPANQPTNSAPGPMGQAKDPAGVSQAKSNPAKDSPLKTAWWWPFGKKDTDER